MKFIHIADVHLGMQPDKGKKWSQERAREIWESFAAIIDIVEAEQPDLLLIAGDLFHDNPKASELKEVNALFKRIDPVRVVLIAGNHDYLRPGSRLDGFTWNENVAFIRSPELQSIYFDDIDTAVYGFSYNRRNIHESLTDMLQSVNGAFEKGPGHKKPGASETEAGNKTTDGMKAGACNILIAHGGEAGNVPVDFKRLSRAGFDYVAMGHIHKPGQMAKNIWYPGSLEPLDKNETGEHGYILGELSASGCEVRFVPIASRSYVHAALEVDRTTTKMSLKNMLAGYMQQHGRENLYCFELRGFREPDISFWEDASEYQGNVVEIMDFTEPDYDFEQLERENADNVIGMFIREILRSDRPDEIKRRALYCGLRELMK